MRDFLTLSPSLSLSLSLFLWAILFACYGSMYVAMMYSGVAFLVRELIG